MAGGMDQKYRRKFLHSCERVGQRSSASFSLELLEERSLLAATPQPFPYVEGFETAASFVDLAGWESHVTGNDTVTITSSSSPHGGTKHLRISNLSQGTTDPEAVMGVDLSTVVDPSNVWLQFYAKGSNFSLAISGDGVTWQSMRENELADSTFHRIYAYDFDSELAAAGITQDQDVFVKFIGSSYGSVYLDNVEVTGVDSVSPYIARVTAAAPDAPLNAVVVTFNEAIDPLTFNAGALSIDSQFGQSTGVETPLDLGDGKTFRVTLSNSITVGGSYRVEFDFSTHGLPEDLAGHSLDQSRRGTPTTSFYAGGQLEVGPSTIPAVPYIQDFSGPADELEGWYFDGGSVAGERLVFTGQGINSGGLILSPSPSHAVLKIDLSDSPAGYDVHLQFGTLVSDNIELAISNDGVNYASLGELPSNDSPYYDYSGNHDLNLTRAAENLVDLQQPIYLRWRFSSGPNDISYTSYLDNVILQLVESGPGPRVIDLSTPSNSSLDSFTVTFDRPIHPSSFDFIDVTVFDPLGNAVAVAGNPLDSGDQQTFTVQLASVQTIKGNYRVQIGPDIYDSSGRRLDQNEDEFFGGVDDIYAGVLELVAAAQTLAITEGYEPGGPADLDGWSFATTADARVAISTTNEPRGLAHLELSANDGQASAILRLDLTDHAAETDLYVGYWVRSLASQHSLRVEISADGSTWQLAKTTLIVGSTGYFYDSFDLDQALQQNGIAQEGDIFLRFRTTADNAHFFLDDVEVASGDFNRPPVISGNFYVMLSAVEDTPRSINVSQFVTSLSPTDPDGDSLSFRVESIYGSLLRGGAPVQVGDFLALADTVTWTPPVNVNGGGKIGFSLRAWDGELPSLLVSRAELNISAVNDAPVLNPAAVTDFAASQAGATVTRRISELLASSFSDIDSSTETSSTIGIAITGVDGLVGTWYYSTNGSTYTALPVPSDAAAVILKRDDYLRFIPSTSVAGVATVTYRIWDRINRTTGSMVDLSSPGSVGGTTDFSIETATSSARFSLAPIANAGGPYIIYEGQSLFLDASASSDPEGGPLTYSWDVNGDGTYGDAIGSTPTLTWAQLDALGIRSGPLNRNVRARVTDDIGLTTTSPTVTLEIRNSPPVAQILGPNFLVRGQTRDFTFAATDPSTTDQAATFHYLVDWEGDGYLDADLTGSGWGVAASHAYTASGVYTMRMVALDRDGGISAMVEQVITVVNWVLLADPNDSSKIDLHWGGTTGIDAYGFLPGIVITQAENNLFFGTPSVTLLPAYNGKTYVYGQAGGDLVFADVMANPLVVDGGDGNDVLVGGRAGDTLLGGAGADILLGGTLEADGGDWLDGGEGDDLLIGHLGADTLRGGAGSDLLLAGGLNFGASLPNAVYSIQAEWTSGRSLDARVENLTGTGSGPRNNGDFFLQASATLLDDAAIDDVMDQSSESWLLVDFDEDLATHLPADILTEIG